MSMIVDQPLVMYQQVNTSFSMIIESFQKDVEKMLFVRTISCNIAGMFIIVLVVLLLFLLLHFVVVVSILLPCIEVCVIELFLVSIFVILVLLFAFKLFMM